MTAAGSTEEQRATDGASRLQAARKAVAEHRWAEALELLRAADEAGLLEREDLSAYGDAAWWTGQLTIAIRARERAFTAHLKAGDRERAAATALAVANDHGHRLQSSLMAGWVRRAARLLEGLPECPGHAYLARARLNGAISRGDLDEALDQAERVMEIADRLGDRDLEGLGLQDKGRVLVARGEVEEGLALLDEAVVLAIAGDMSPFATAVVYCNATVACQDLADYRRALEFSDAARDWCSRQAISGFPGMCRVRRAEVTRLRGAWDEAEREAKQACVELEDFSLDYAGEGFYQIGEIRLRTGDLPAAEDAFRRSHELGRPPVPGLALLRLAQGKPAAGAALLKRSLDDPAVGRLARARLLAASVENSLAMSEIDHAKKAAEELAEIARDFGTHALLAASAHANGAVALALGNAVAALRESERARRLWQETDAPYEVALSRMLLAEAHVLAHDRDAAQYELQAARTAFERLGARPDVERSGVTLRGLSDDSEPSGTAVTPTMMFTDIVRSTQLVEAIGDGAWTRLLHWHDRTIRELVARHGGEEVDHAGDGFFVAFGDANGALDCALEIQDRLAEHRRQHGFAPSVRIGLHVGPAVRQGGSYAGSAVHAAARIGAAAEGDEILASTDVLAAAGDGYPHSEPREIVLRGMRGPLSVVTVRPRSA
jgi:class 3 adenylate cyclase